MIFNPKISLQLTSAHFYYPLSISFVRMNHVLINRLQDYGNYFVERTTLYVKCNFTQRRNATGVR